MSNRNEHLNLFRVGLFRMKMHAKLSMRKNPNYFENGKKLLDLTMKVAQMKD